MISRVAVLNGDRSEPTAACLPFPTNEDFEMSAFDDARVLLDALRRQTFDAVVIHVSRLWNDRSMMAELREIAPALPRLLAVPIGDATAFQQAETHEPDDILTCPTHPAEVMFRLARIRKANRTPATTEARNGSAQTNSNAEVLELRKRLRACEREHIVNALSEHAFNKEAAAEALGIGLSSLYRKIGELDIDAVGRKRPGSSNRKMSRSAGTNRLHAVSVCPVPAEQFNAMRRAAR